MTEIKNMDNINTPAISEEDTRDYFNQILRLVSENFVQKRVTE